MRLISTLCLAASMMATPALAQQASDVVVMRRVIAPPVQVARTYQATYAPYGSCSGGVKTAAVSACTRSDGVVVANSFCTAKTVSCATCDMTQGLSGGWGIMSERGTFNTVSEAKQACEAQANSLTFPAPSYRFRCVWNSSTKRIYYGVNGYEWGGSLNAATPDYYGASCAPTP